MRRTWADYEVVVVRTQRTTVRVRGVDPNDAAVAAVERAQMEWPPDRVDWTTDGRPHAEQVLLVVPDPDPGAAP